MMAPRLKTSLRHGGFSLLELLVVVFIISLIVSISVYGLARAKRFAKSKATEGAMHAIGVAIDAYELDFNGYIPDSNNSVTYGAANVTNGSSRLAEALLGYLDSTSDGAGPTNLDSKYGFRMSTIGKGRIYGPYMPANIVGGSVSANVDIDINGKYYFVDGYGNALLYYKSQFSGTRYPTSAVSAVFGANPIVVISGGGGTGATATATVTLLGAVSGIVLTNAGSGYTSVPTVAIFGGGGTGATATAALSGASVSATFTVTNGGSGYMPGTPAIFDSLDNTTFAASTHGGNKIDSPNGKDPSTATAPDFFKSLGNTSGTDAGSNTFDAGNNIVGRDTYLLISAGPDQTYFTGDEIITPDH